MPLTVIALVIPWVVLALGCWIGYQLVRQNGRILLRLEALEEALVRLGVAPGDAAGMPRHAARSEGLPVGAEAPAFELPDLTGTRRALADWRGRRLLLIFFNPQCGFCQQMVADLAALPIDGADGHPVPIVVTAGDAETNRAWVTEHAVACPVLLQGETDLASRYQANGTPVGYLLDESGRIASELAVGARALLALTGGPGTPAAAAAPRAEPAGALPGKRQPALPTLKPLAESRLKRDGLPAGTPAPEFTLPTLDGRDLSLEAYRGRHILLVFSDPHCGPCDVLAPQLEALHRRTPDVPVVMVSRGEIEDNRRKAHQYGLSFPVVLQRQWEVSREYAMFGTPIGYLIDEAGVIAADVAVGAPAILALHARGAARPNGTKGLGSTPTEVALGTGGSA